MIIIGNKIMDSIKGNGDITSIEIETSAFDKITNKSQGDVRYHKSDVCRAVLTIDSNLTEYFKVFTKADELVFKQEPNLNYSPTECLLDVYAPTICMYHLKGSGDFETSDSIDTNDFDLVIDGSGDSVFDKITSNNLNLEIKGSGDIQISAVNQNTSIDIKGSGDVNISGKTQNASITIKGSGNIKAKDFKTDTAHISIMGSGDVSMHVEKDIDASIFGSGDIKYSGSPSVKSKIFGSGDVRKR